jgi:hypothetical protein
MQTPFTLSLQDDWRDVAAELEDNAPYTFVKPGGKGAFQISIALYESGTIANLTAAELLSMLREFAYAQGLNEESNVIIENKGRQLASASFKFDKDFIRAWYVSDGVNLAKATYVCTWGESLYELPDCERMVRTLAFCHSAKA